MMGDHHNKISGIKVFAALGRLRSSVLEVGIFPSEVRVSSHSNKMVLFLQQEALWGRVPLTVLHMLVFSHQMPWGNLVYRAFWVSELGIKDFRPYHMMASSGSLDTS